MADRDLLDELPDGLVVLEEPNMSAPVMVWRVPPGGITFHKIQSARFAKEGLELAPYPGTISELLLANTVKDLALSEDARMALYISQMLSGSST